jgi:hypothetical protein
MRGEVLQAWLGTHIVLTVVELELSAMHPGYRTGNAKLEIWLGLV